VELILAEEEGSSPFIQKTIQLTSEKIIVGRSTKDRPAAVDNAVFNSRVLSKEHAVLSYKDDCFYLQDLGSSNGTFINNTRLSKGGEVSRETRVYTQDIIRFGSQAVDRARGQSEKCVMTKVTLLKPQGEELSRPEEDRLFAEPGSKSRKKKKRVKFDEDDASSEEKDEDVAEYKATIATLEKKLRRKTNEVKNLSENLDQTRLREESFRLEKEEMEKEKEDLRSEIATACTEKTTFIRNHEEQERVMKHLKTELDRHKEKETVSRETEQEMRAVMEREKGLRQEIATLTKDNQLLADQLAVKLKEEMENIRVVDLESELDESKRRTTKLSEENWLLQEKLRVELETGHRRESEVAALQARAPIEDSEAVKEKLAAALKAVKDLTQEVEGLNGLVSRADEIVKEKEREIAWLSEMLDKHSSQIQETESDYQSLQHCMTEENETVHQIEREMVRLIQVIQDEQNINVVKDDIIAGCKEEIKTLTEKSEESSQELEKIRQTSEKNLDYAINEKNKELDKLRQEVDGMRDQLLKADTSRGELEECKQDLTHSRALSDQLRRREEEHNSIIARKGLEMDQLRKQLVAMEEQNNKNESAIESLVTQLHSRKEEENSELSSKVLQARLIREQEQSKELEDEIIQLRLSIEETSNQLPQGESAGGRDGDTTTDPALKLALKLKEDEINQLKAEMYQEQQIVAHVQMTQEKELLQKEKEIERLQDLLTNVNPPPLQQVVNTSLPPTNGVYSEDDDDTLSFHDALSEDEDILLEDLDSDSDHQEYRGSDIADLSLG